MHKSYIRDVKDSDTVYFFIHGIMGSPVHFDRFIAHLPQNVAVHNILLEGHGKEMKDFSHATMEKWRKQVRQHFYYLDSRYENIVVIAHSMGTLFAFENSFIFKDKISHMFLLASPLSLAVRPSYIPIYLKIAFGVKSESEIEREVKFQCSVNLKPSPLKYIPWLPKYIDLFKRVVKTNRFLDKVSVPCTIFQSKYDELVSLRTINILSRNDKFKVYTLENSTHTSYSDEDLKFLIDEFKKLI